MSNVKNDLSPATAVLSRGKLCQRLFSASPYYHKLITICSFCTLLFLLKGNTSHYIIRFPIIHILSCGLNIVVLKAKVAYLPSKCPHNSQYLLTSIASLIFIFWDFPETYWNEKKDFINWTFLHSDLGYFCFFTSIRIPVTILRELLLEHLISVALFSRENVLITEAEDTYAWFSNVSFFSPEILQGKFCLSTLMQRGKILAYCLFKHHSGGI